MLIHVCSSCERGINLEIYVEEHRLIWYETSEIRLIFLCWLWYY